MNPSDFVLLIVSIGMAAMSIVMHGWMIGAGSVVARDIPDGVFAAGNPCRVIREIAEAV